MSLFIPASLTVSPLILPVEPPPAEVEPIDAGQALPKVSPDAFSALLAPIPSSLLSPAALNLNWEIVFSSLLESGKLSGLCLIEQSDGKWLFQSGLCNPDNIPTEIIRECMKHYDLREIKISNEINNKNSNEEFNIEKNSLNSIQNTSKNQYFPLISPEFSGFKAFQTTFLIYSRTFTSFYSICKYKRIGILCHLMPFRCLLISLYTRPQSHSTIIPWIEKEISKLKN